MICYWVVPEKIHPAPKEEISAILRGRGEQVVSHNIKRIRTSKGGRGVHFQLPPWGEVWNVFWNDPLPYIVYLLILDRMYNSPLWKVHHFQAIEQVAAGAPAGGTRFTAGYFV
jgi:hypothetical protein